MFIDRAASILLSARDLNVGRCVVVRGLLARLGIARESGRWSVVVEFCQMLTGELYLDPPVGVSNGLPHNSYRLPLGTPWRVLV